MWSYVSEVDHEVMRRANWWRAPRWIRVWMICATRGGDGWLWYALALAVMLFGGERRWAAVGAACLASGSGIVIFVWLKRLIRRPRPCALEPHCWARLLPPDQFSFPSGHTITAFAVAVPVSIVYPGLFAGLLCCALSVAVSRILLGMHFLSDVVAGALTGTLLGYAACGMVL
ncbi:MAG: phosphatase PAP2 family protein [Acidobacteria bacterium]|nr:phosphatase PAP2 family protein [Acidobacteriota bacterium]